jgi:uncharacterized membrane protein (DUF373 family)
MPDSPTSQEEPATVRLINRAMHVAEDVLYALVALVLVVLALVVLIDAGFTLAQESSDDVTSAVETTLSSLLIVFILVELLGAVRATIKERKLIAEPFLLVGVIASIKEIIVVGGIAGKDMTVEDAMLKIGVLGAVILALSLAAFLLRRKEREPDE